MSKTQDVIQEIKDKADIVELISDHVILKRSGANYLGLCPFHKDSKPSMYISPQKGIFKCFACGTGGDVFKFWSEYHKKDFKETLRDLAQKYGVELDFSKEAQEQSQEKNKFIRMHELAAKFYLDRLLRAEDAKTCREYLKSRDLPNSAIQDFMLGYSPNDPKDRAKLIKHLINELKTTEEEILKAGLAVKREANPSTKRPGGKDQYWDRFRNRLMIPIHNERGQVIAFGARLIDDPKDSPNEDNKDSQNSTNTQTFYNPKYLNSPETDIYHKGDHLYGLHLAKQEIRKEDSAIVVEGYFDVIRAHLAGIKNVVANQGTALTSKQAKLLAKFSDSKRIYLCFDTDKAGEEATERAVATILEASGGVSSPRIEIRIIRVPNGKDPDELIQKEGADAFLAPLRTAPLLIDYQIEKITSSVDLKSPQSKSEAVEKLAGVLAFVDRQVERAEYVNQISEKLKLDPDALKADFQVALKKAQAKRQGPFISQNPYEYLNQKRAKEAQRNEHTGENQFTPGIQSKTKKVNGQIIYLEDSISSTEKEILIMAVSNREILENFLNSEKELNNGANKKIIDALMDISFENPDIKDAEMKFQMLSDKLSSERDCSEILADIGIALDEETNKADLKTRYEDALRKLRRLGLNLRMQELASKIKEIEKEAETEENNQIWTELQKEKKELLGLLQTN